MPKLIFRSTGKVPNCSLQMCPFLPTHASTFEMIFVYVDVSIVNCTSTL